MDLFGQPFAQAEEEQPPANPLLKGAVPLEAQPLAERMRPRSFEEWIGQPSITGPEAPLRRMLRQGRLPSLIFWGPPGCGKTTLARLVAGATGMFFQPLSAVTCGIKEVKEMIERAARRLTAGRGGTILFVDEIHRFNKGQQDAFLPHVENGTIVLIGATTENVSFSIIAPLLSRCRVITLNPLSLEEIGLVLGRALTDKTFGLGNEEWQVEDAVLERIAQLSDGDARRALNLLEQCAYHARSARGEPVRGELVKSAPSAPSAPSARGELVESVPSVHSVHSVHSAPPKLTLEDLAQVLQRDHLLYDRSGEEHFNLISALHKSLRASEPQAALYWLARMLAAGEDPLYVARRMIRFAAEDVGLADPQALSLALAALESYRVLGSPEGELGLAEAAVYLATAPKSNSIDKAFSAAGQAVREHGALPTPLHLRNAPTGLMKSLGYGLEYQYDHNAPDHFSGQPCLPEELLDLKFYEPGPFGYEREIQKRLEWWEKKRREK